MTKIKLIKRTLKKWFIIKKCADCGQYTMRCLSDTKNYYCKKCYVINKKRHDAMLTKLLKHSDLILCMKRDKES